MGKDMMEKLKGYARNGEREKLEGYPTLMLMSIGLQILEEDETNKKKQQLKNKERDGKTIEQQEMVYSVKEKQMYDHEEVGDKLKRLLV